jgi:tRNA(fMet)-specific endonuclease VapC
MKHCMLDTNTVSLIIRNHPVVTKHLAAMPVDAVCISAVTAAELLYGLAKRPEAHRLHNLVTTFLHHVDVLPWDSDAANSHAGLRANCEKQGTSLAALDMLIAAHAVATDNVLITNDQGFRHVTKQLKTKDWTKS